MGKTGRKSAPNQAETIWRHCKSSRVTVDVTPVGKAGFKDFCSRLGLTQAEFIERAARGLIQVTDLMGKPLPGTIQFLISQELISDRWDPTLNPLDQLADEAGLEVEDLRSILDGSRPDEDALIALGSGSLFCNPPNGQESWETEDLLKLVERQYYCQGECSCGGKGVCNIPAKTPSPHGV